MARQAAEIDEREEEGSTTEEEGMLARTHDEVVDVDALWDLVGACARQAIKDYTSGPEVVGQAHYETARHFLEVSGLIDRVPPPAMVGPHQVDVFRND